jgi:hypothetical protein
VDGGTVAVLVFVDEGTGEPVEVSVALSDVGRLTHILASNSPIANYNTC